MAQDPKAIDVVQYILEQCLLRREKNMKDKDGKPIVDLPLKTVSFFINAGQAKVLNRCLPDNNRDTGILSLRTQNLRCNIRPIQAKVHSARSRRHNQEFLHFYSGHVDEAATGGRSSLARHEQGVD